MSPRFFRFRPILASAAIGLWLLTIAPADATRYPPADLDRMLLESGAAVIATVMGQRYRTYGEDERPYTDFTLLVRDIPFGEELLAEQLDGDEITLPVFGGMSRDGMRARIVDAPELRLGETYLLFLRSEDWWLSPIAGFRHGAMRLVYGGEDVGHVVLTMDGRALMGMQDGRLLFQAPRFDRNEGSGPSPDVARGTLMLDRRAEAASPDKAEDEKEEREVVEVPSVEPENAEPVDRRQQLRSWLGAEPMNLETFLEQVRERREALDEQLSEEDRKVTLTPRMPSPEAGAAPRASQPTQ